MGSPYKLSGGSAYGKHSSDLQPLRPVQSRMRGLFGVSLLGCSVLVGCHTTQPAVTRDALVGTYAYKSQDPDGKATEHTWDHLLLKEGGKYDLVQGGPTKVKSEKTGFWTFTGGDPAQVMLDHTGYPVVVKGGEVRLMIDYDTGIWYSKSK